MEKIFKWVELLLVCVVSWRNIILETECQLSSVPSRNSSKAFASTAKPRTGLFAYIEVIDRAINQVTAEAECQKKGGNLCSFTKTKEFNKIIEAMRDKNWIYWTGLKYTGNKSSPWEFVDGTDPTFAAGKVPANFDPNFGWCITIEGLNGGRLLQKHCTERRYYICKIGHAQPSTTQSSQLVFRSM